MQKNNADKAPSYRPREFRVGQGPVPPLVAVPDGLSHASF